MKVLPTFLSVLAVALIICAPNVLADCPYTEYGWTSAIGAEAFDQARGIAVDDDGAIYIVGSFEQIVDFDPSKRKDKLKAKGRDGHPDIYLTSYSGEGLYRWTARIGGSAAEYGDAVTMTPAGDVVLTGAFYEKVDFNPTKRKDKHKSHGGADAFVTLLHPDGSYGWTRTFGGEQSDVGWGTAADNEGNIIVAGDFMATVDFNPGRGVDNRTSNGGEDVFVTKLGPKGSYQWTRTFGGSLRDTAWGVATDADGNVIVTGEYRGTVDFDPTEGVDIHTSNGADDVFITKLGSDGSYHWTHTFGGTDINDKGFDVVTDGAGNVYVTGGFVGIVDFDRRGRGDIRVGQGFSDIFVTKRAPDGGYQWTRTIGGTAIEAAFGIALNDLGSLVIAGNYSGTVDFDFGEGVDQHTSNGGRDVFVTTMTTDGGYVSTQTFGGSDGNDGAEDVAIDPDGNIVACGLFASQNVDFDPTSGVDLHSSNGKFDFFITKHYCGQCEFIERHTVVGKRGKIISTVRALAPGGKVTVECTGPGEPVRQSGEINNENTAKLKFKNLPKGAYECLITKIKDPDGHPLCQGPLAPRPVTVK